MAQTLVYLSWEAIRSQVANGSTVGVIMIHHLPLVDQVLSRNNVAVQRES